MSKFNFRDLFASEEAYARRNDPIPMERIQAMLKEREDIILEKERDEKARIESIVCPSCGSDRKDRYERREDNGIIGPGFRSYLVQAYWICKGCGSHYTKE